MGRKRKKGKDQPRSPSLGKSDVRRLLAFLNAAATHEEMSAVIEFSDDPDESLEIAGEILKHRADLGKFKTLEQVENIPAVGTEGMGKIVVSLGAGLPSPKKVFRPPRVGPAFGAGVGGDLSGCVDGSSPVVRVYTPPMVYPFGARIQVTPGGEFLSDEEDCANGSRPIGFDDDCHTGSTPWGQSCDCYPGGTPRGGGTDCSVGTTPSGWDADCFNGTSPGSADCEAGSTPGSDGADCESGSSPAKEDSDCETGASPAGEGGDCQTGSTPSGEGADCESGSSPSGEGGDCESGSSPSGAGGDCENGSSV